MKRKSLSGAECPIAKALDCVGEWWSLLIIRDAFHGLKRFDEFQKSLEIAPNMLTRRLNHLVEQQLLEKVGYSARPPRFEYHLTEKGRSLYPVLISLLNWGNQHLDSDALSIQLVDRLSEKAALAVMIDRNTGNEITTESHRIAPGPGASDAMRDRLQRIPALTESRFINKKEASDA